MMHMLATMHITITHICIAEANNNINRHKYLNVLELVYDICLIYKQNQLA
jgi:hypothetical protein